MGLNTLLELLANNTHHQVNMNELLVAQPAEVKSAFANNDIDKIKTMLDETGIIADRQIVTAF